MTAVRQTADPLVGASLHPILSFGKAAAASTQGRKPGSFRVESYGMLAALRFLLHYITFWNVIPALPALVHLEYTDSKSLL
jgi:hypothetical protein